MTLQHESTWNMNYTALLFSSQNYIDLNVDTENDSSQQNAMAEQESGPKIVKPPKSDKTMAEKESGSKIVKALKSNKTKNKKTTDLPAFLSLMDEMKRKNDNLSVCIAEINRKQSEILANPFNDATFNKQLESLNANVKTLATEIRNKLKVIEADVKSVSNSDQSSSDYRIKTSQYQSLLANFVRIMTDYNNVQMDYRDKCKTRIQRKLEIVDQRLNNDQLEEMIESHNPAIFTQSIIADTQKAKQTLADIEARHSDILQLESAVVELNQMFSDILLLVSAQGETVDNIEKSIHNCKEYVINADNTLNEAKKSKSKLRKKKVWLAIGGAVIVVLIIVIIAVSV